MNTKAESVITTSVNNTARILIAQEVGWKRQIAFYRFLCSRYRPEDGYAVKVNHKTKGSPEPDIVVYKDRKTIIAIEVKNYKMDGYFTEPKFNRAIMGLLRYNCYRLLVVSSEENLRVRKMKVKNGRVYYYFIPIEKIKKRLKRYGIEVMVMGRQDKPSREKIESIVNGEVLGWEDEDPEPDNYEVVDGREQEPFPINN